MNVFGMPIIADERMVKKVRRYPKTKKKRILKKWEGRYKTVPRDDAFIYGDRIICHPSIYSKLTEGIKYAEETKCE